jgi:hypothetical protein
MERQQLTFAFRLQCAEDKTRIIEHAVSEGESNYITLQLERQSNASKVGTFK